MHTINLYKKMKHVTKISKIINHAKIKTDLRMIKYLVRKKYSRKNDKNAKAAKKP